MTYCKGDSDDVMTESKVGATVLPVRPKNASEVPKAFPTDVAPKVNNNVKPGKIVMLENNFECRWNIPLNNSEFYKIGSKHTGVFGYIIEEGYDAQE